MKFNVPDVQTLDDGDEVPELRIQVKERSDTGLDLIELLVLLSIQQKKICSAYSSYYSSD